MRPEDTPSGMETPLGLLGRKTGVQTQWKLRLGPQGVVTEGEETYRSGGDIPGRVNTETGEEEPHPMVQEPPPEAGQDPDLERSPDSSELIRLLRGPQQET